MLWAQGIIFLMPELHKYSICRHDSLSREVFKRLEYWVLGHIVAIRVLHTQGDKRAGFSNIFVTIIVEIIYM